jgi:hypothetical protein
MIKLDDNLLAELGLQALPAEEKKALLKHIYETLEMRVGTTLARQMTDAQLDEFESFINSNDEAGALRWLETNFPNYKDVVAQEFEVLKNEIRQASPQILAGAQAQQQQMQQAAPQPQYQQPVMPQQQYQSQPQMPVDPYQTPQPQQGFDPSQQQAVGGFAQPQQGYPQAPQYQQPQPQQPPYDQDQFGQAA